MVWRTRGHGQSEIVTQWLQDSLQFYGWQCEAGGPVTHSHSAQTDGLCSAKLSLSLALIAKLYHKSAPQWTQKCRSQTRNRVGRAKLTVGTLQSKVKG